MTKRLWIVTACGILTGARTGVRNRARRIRARPLRRSTSTPKPASRSLRPSRARWRRSRRFARHEQRWMWPRASSFRPGCIPIPRCPFMQQIEPGGTDSQSRIEMQWPLDLFRKTGRVAVADQELQATQQSVSDRERLLAADVRMKYGEVVAAVRDLSVSDDLVATTTRQSDLLRARVEQGATPPLERNMVEVELRRLEAERLLQAGQVDRAVIELKRLLGMRANAPLQLRDSLEQLVMREATCR